VHLSEPYIVVIVVAIALLLFWWWGSTRSRRSEKELAASRPDDTLETFVASFRPEVQAIARAMYSEFQAYTYSGKFPFRKSDRIVQILGIDEIDLNEGLQRVANQLGLRKPTKEDYARFPQTEAFEDFVEFIHYLKGSQVPVSSERSG
jgi:hypothetical protein